MRKFIWVHKSDDTVRIEMMQYSYELSERQLESLVKSPQKWNILNEEGELVDE